MDKLIIIGIIKICQIKQQVLDDHSNAVRLSQAFATQKLWRGMAGYRHNLNIKSKLARQHIKR